MRIKQKSGFPRSKDRGLIEAFHCSGPNIRSSNAFPRSKDRGLIEADVIAVSEAVLA